MALKLTQYHGVDYAILSKNIANQLPELLADEAKVIVTENTDISILSSNIYILIFVITILIMY